MKSLDCLQTSGANEEKWKVPIKTVCSCVCCVYVCGLRSEYNHTAMKRAVVDRVAGIKGLLSPYHVSQVQLCHVNDEFEHGRSTVEAAWSGKWRTMPSSAGDVYFCKVK